VSLDGVARVPIVELFGNLLVSVRGELDDRQVDALRSDVAEKIEQREPSGLVLDLSGVEILDSYMTRALRDLVVAARLMGVRSVVCGMRPAVAITLVDMGLEVPGALVAMNLDRAVERLALEELADDEGDDE
jgi:rsbT antagonist protein RsbS